MRAEWGNDEGTSSAARHRAALVGWLRQDARRARRFQAGFRADLGRRPVRELQGRRRPAVLHRAYDSFKFARRRTTSGARPTRRIDLPGNRAAAKMLATRPDRGRASTPPMPTSRCTIRSATPSPTRSSISTTTATAFTIRSCRSRSIATAARWSRSAAACRHSIASSRPKSISTRRRRRRRLFDLGAATARILAESPYRVALAGLVRLVACVPDRQEPLPLPRHAGRPAHVRRAASRRLRLLARLSGGGDRG